MEDKKIRLAAEEDRIRPERKIRSPSARQVREESSQAVSRRRKFQTNRYQKFYGRETAKSDNGTDGSKTGGGKAAAGINGGVVDPKVSAKKAVDRKRGAAFRRKAGTAAGNVAGMVTGKTADVITRYADDNTGAQSLKETMDVSAQTASAAAGNFGRGIHSRKLMFTDGEVNPVKEESMSEGRANARRQRRRYVRQDSGKSAGAAARPKGAPFGRQNTTTGYAGRRRTQTAGFGTANPLSKRWQKRTLQQEYAAVRTGRVTESARTAGWRGGAYGWSIFKRRGRRTRLFNAVRISPKGLFIAAAAVVLLIVIVAASMSAATTVLQGTTNAVMASSYTATDRDIKKAEAAYRRLEAELQDQIDRVKTDYPGYQNYETDIAGIGHNPYDLAALLTVLHEDYKAKDVEETLKQILALQYDLQINGASPQEGSKTVRVGQSLGTVTTSGYCNCVICCGKWAGGRTASGTVPRANHTIAVDAKNPIVPLGTKVIMNGVEYTVEDTGAFAKYGVDFDVYYDSHAEAAAHGHKKWDAVIVDDYGTTEVTVRTGISGDTLTVSLENRGIDYAAENMGLSEDDLARYELLKELKGNRPELFADDIYANAGSGSGDYTIPPEELSDERFANMIREAEKYLGYPYVWGGSSPSTSFDCSGFVSYVINHCGNGWSYGRLTANGLYQTTARVSKADAKPGDLIFFQGTYKTSGASHVGIYVGNGRMIHCGNPIQYTSIETSYWQRHFLGFGRLP